MSIGMWMKQTLLGPPAQTEVAEGAEARPDAPLPGRTPIAVREARGRLVTDVLMLALAAAVETLSAPSADIDRAAGWRIGFAVAVLLLMFGRGRYRAVVSGRFLDDARTILSATAVAAMLITFLRVAFTDNSAVAEESIRSWLFAAVYMVAGRGVLAMITERLNATGRGTPTVIVGAGRVGHLVARRLVAHPELGLRPVGFVDSKPLEVEKPSDVPLLGSADDVEEIVRRHGVEHAIFAFSTESHDAQLQISRALQRMRISVSIIPRLFEGVPDKVAFARVGGLPLVTIYPSDPGDWRITVKYAADRVAALIAIVLLSPILLLAALGVLISVGRPILFRQPRVGLDGRVFEILKFRSMKSDPEVSGQANAAWAAAQAAAAESGADGDQGGAPPRRPTRFGWLIRRSGIDELPQLFNVLKGEMSIVGPRPEQPAYVEMFEERIRRYDERHRVKAGITGWAQVHGLRGNTPLDDRVEWDNYYIENWSPWLDLKILLLTGLELVRGAGE
jgi:exopolysaccharide biosynthesis polyprenyl glycosylphosphotransferase